MAVAGERDRASLWGSTGPGPQPVDGHAVERSPGRARPRANCRKGSIIAFEIGNEPDIYGRASRQNPTSGGRGSRTLPRNISATSYAKAFGSYARAPGRAVRECRSTRAALAEPAKKPQFWVSKLLASSHPGLSAVTAHRYPYSACSRPAARTFPTIARVLSEGATAGLARSVRGAVVISSRSGLPQGLVAHPLPDGMALFARTLVTDPQFVPLRLTTRRSLHIKAWGVRVRATSCMCC